MRRTPLWEQSEIARYYDSQTSRFLNEDRLKSIGSGLNFYSYVENNPFNLPVSGSDSRAVYWKGFVSDPEDAVCLPKESKV